MKAAAVDALQRSQGTVDFQVDHWTVQFVKPGDVGPFQATASVCAARGGGRCGVDATLVDDGRDGRIVANVSALFSRVDR
jgi:acyl-coenzyme A thioesterase PaaI-like protein